MATIKKGILTPSPQWWRHLRDWKRDFWHRERKAAVRDIDDRVSEVAALDAIDREIDWLVSRDRGDGMPPV